MSTSFSRRNPLLTSASKSSVFALDFFHSLFGFGHGGDVGDVDPWADPPASSRDLFFPAPVFIIWNAILRNTFYIWFLLQDNASIIEDLQEENSRTLGNYSRRLQDYSRMSWSTF
jgi:hypothetical protein